MKIEFELEMQEAVLILDILRNAAYKTSNPNVKSILGNIINEIESDSQVAHFILNGIKHEFYTNNLTKNKIYPHSNMEYGLGIPKPFLHETRGLTKMANFILFMTVKKFKPEIAHDNIKKVTNPGIKKCVMINDVIALIQTNYEAT